jgi:hypothetical protein
MTTKPKNHWDDNSNSALVREFREAVEHGKAKGWLRMPRQPLIAETPQPKPHAERYTAEWKKNHPQATS